MTIHLLNTLSRFATLMGEYPYHHRTSGLGGTAGGILWYIVSTNGPVKNPHPKALIYVHCSSALTLLLFFLRMNLVNAIVRSLITQTRESHTY